MLDLETIKTALEEKLNELQVRAADIENSLSSPKNADSEERAVELENDQTITAIGAITETEIREIKIALSRIHSGDYSTCATCGKHIAKDRLLALPWTSKCARCA